MNDLWFCGSAAEWQSDHREKIALGSLIFETFGSAAEWQSDQRGKFTSF